MFFYRNNGEGMSVSGPHLPAQAVKFHKQISSTDEFNASDGY
jgi:hypothetical protein